MLHRIQDPTYLVRDWFVNQTSGFSVRFFFLQSVNFLSGFLNVQTLYWLLFLIFGGLTVLGVYLIADTLFHDCIVGYLTILLILFGQAASLGSTWIIDSFFVPYTVATTLVVWAVLCFLKERYVLGLALVGLATLFHVQIGIDTALIFGAYLVVVFFQKRDFFLVIKGGLAYLIFAIWNLIPSFATLGSGVPGREIVEIIGNIRSPWHYVPFQFSLESYLLTASVVLLFILSIRYKPQTKYHRFISFLWLTLTIFCFIYTVGTEFFSIPSLIKLQVFRLTPLLITFAYMYGANYLVNNFKAKPSTITVALSFLVVFSLLTTSAYLALISLLLFVGYQAYKERRALPFAIALVLTIISFYFRGWAMIYFVLGLHWKRVLLAVTAGLVVSYLTPKVLKGWWLVFGLVVAVSLVCLYPVIKNGQINYNRDGVTEEAYQWVTANTPEDSLFISPPYLEDFRLGTKRAIIIDFKTFPFKDSDMVGWRDRIIDLTNKVAFVPGGDRTAELMSGFRSLQQVDFERLRDKYNADYLFTDNLSETLNFPVVFQNDRYRVYELSK